MFVKATIPFMIAMVALKKIRTKLKESYQKKPLIRLEWFSPCYISQSEYRITFSQKPREKGKLMRVLHWEDLTNTMPTVHEQQTNHLMNQQSRKCGKI